MPISKRFVWLLMSPLALSCSGKTSSKSAASAPSSNNANATGTIGGTGTGTGTGQSSGTTPVSTATAALSGTWVQPCQTAVNATQQQFVFTATTAQITTNLYSDTACQSLKESTVETGALTTGGASLHPPAFNTDYSQNVDSAYVPDNLTVIAIAQPKLVMTADNAADAQALASALSGSSPGCAQTVSSTAIDVTACVFPVHAVAQSPQEAQDLPAMRGCPNAAVNGLNVDFTGCTVYDYYYAQPAPSGGFLLTENLAAPTPGTSADQRFAGALTFTNAATTPASQPASPPLVIIPPMPPVATLSTYFATTCAVCHGATGSTVPSGSTLPALLGNTSYGETAWQTTVRSGVTGSAMVAFPTSTYPDAALQSDFTVLTGQPWE